MRLLSSRRALGAALVPLLLVGVTACGGDTKDEKSAKDSSSVFSDTKDEGQTPSVKAGDTVKADDFIALMASGQKAMTTASINANIEAAGATITMDGVMDLTTKSPSMKLSMDMPAAAAGAQGAPSKVEMVLVDGKIYMSLAADQYMEVDPSALGGQDLTAQMDPSKSMEDLKPGIKEVIFVGEEDKGGQEARHYTVPVDPAKVKSMQETPGIPAELKYDMWLDDKNRMVAMEMDLGGLGATTMTFSNWGDDVSIDAPDPSKVTKAPAGMGG